MRRGRAHRTILQQCGKSWPNCRKLWPKGCEFQPLKSVPDTGLSGTGCKPKCPREKSLTIVSVQSHRTENQPQFPKGLIGQKCTANVLVSGVNCNCVLDTGSQVTTVSASFYQNHLSEHPIQPIDDLDVEGTNGQHVPYLWLCDGYQPEVSKKLC